MDASRNEWLKKNVFRVRGLPSTVETFHDVASLLNKSLGGNPPADKIRVFSLATALSFGGDSRSKVATIMFTTAPSIICDEQGDGWVIPAKGSRDSTDLLLDTHFLGMTPLNDVDATTYSSDCIAISGLASHPFGSWQPRGSDKSFMWIRDKLPKDLQGARMIIYGYDSKLQDSLSFQSISDLASGLIELLQTYGWHFPSARPVAFLAHSLGGLVLKDALVQLANSADEMYRNLLNNIYGVVFFGVPNLGMEQAHFQTIVQNKPNEALIDDIARNSNYLRRLSESFSGSSFNKHFKCFWAYETSESPTIVRTADGRINLNGPRAILVSRESATCRFVQTNPPITFPINTTHSDMVKLTRDSPFYHTIVSKLRIICPRERRMGYSTGDSTQVEGIPNSVADDHNGFSTYTASMNTPISRFEGSQTPLSSSLKVEVDAFKRNCRLREDPVAKFAGTTFSVVQGVIGELQLKQEEQGNLMYMKRLEPFLTSMKAFSEISESANDDVSDIMACVWGPLEYIITTTSSRFEALNSILDAYQKIGEQIPLLRGFQQVLTSSPHARKAVVMIYKDILDFQKEIIWLLEPRRWELLFEASWRDTALSIGLVAENIERQKRLLESQHSIPDFEAVQCENAKCKSSIESKKREHNVHRRVVVDQWLSPFDCATEHESHRNARSIIEDPGRWLLDDPRFQKWFSPDSCVTPLLWMTGNPGAGKTVLASIVVDAARTLPDATVVFFYLKYGDEMRNSFVSVVKSILAQMLTQHSHLLPYLYEKASTCPRLSLPIAEEMMYRALNSCEKTYIILDGLDECGRDDRRKTANWFRRIVEAQVSTEADSIRCLFVSQDDGDAQKDFRNLPVIKITTENRDDLRAFTAVWHGKIEAKFGELRSGNYHISNIISARAQDMFIFAELFAKHLESQMDRRALLMELDPDNLPVKMDNVYERILARTCESRNDYSINVIRKILGWIAFTRRPLRWREVQAAICIDLESQNIDYDRQLLDSPKDLFASFVEVQADGTVELIHGTARDYLSRTFVDPCKVDHSLSMLSLAYLTFPQVDKQRSDDDVESDLMDGTYAFYDYASACWAMHLQSGISGLGPGDELIAVKETLETFIDLHWSATHRRLPDVKRVEKDLSVLQISDSYEKIVQAFAWARKQSSKSGQGPTPDEALDLWEVTKKIRSVLEKMHSLQLSESNTQRLRDFYGTNFFKCPRINCYYYDQGFSTKEEQQNHIKRHERPFLCFVAGCYMGNFGCAKKDELLQHLFKIHGIDMFDEKDDVEFPDPPQEQAPKNNAKAAAIHQCSLCSKKYTQSHNLKNHMRTHDGDKPFACSVCGDKFPRKSDCDRHERRHGGKKFKCEGPLKSGSTWGCGASFHRADELAGHLKSKKGQRCILPQLRELQEDGNVADDSKVFANHDGLNADALLAAGRILPSFGEFLQLCGLGDSRPGSTMDLPP